MRKAVVLTKGEGEAALRLASLFNEGNRIRITEIIAEEGSPVLDGAKGIEGVEPVAATFTVEAGCEQLAAALESSEAELILTEGIDGATVQWLEARFPGRVAAVTNVAEAPREAVAAFARIDSGASKPTATAVTPKTVDEEWADCLHMDFDPAKAAPTEPEAASAGNHAEVAAEEDMNEPQKPWLRRASYSVPAPAVEGTMPPSYFIWALVMTILFSTLPGLVAIYYSMKVSSRFYAGDAEGAQSASRRAQIWIIVSFVVGVLSATVYMPIAMAGIF